MKNRVKYLAILFFAVVGMSSCNPVDEGQLPPSNTSNVTTAQALQLLQGIWYLERVEYISGPICSGGNNTMSRITSTDLAYSGWKIEFTQNIASSLGQPFEAESGNYFQVYSDGGNFTGAYCILDNQSSSNAANLPILWPNWTLSSNDLFLWLGTYLPMESIGFEFGGKIISIEPNQFLLSTNNGLAYFKRENQSEIPLNISGLSGTFIHDNTKSIQSGISVSDEIINGGHTISFTSEIITESAARYYKCNETGGDYSLDGIPIPTFIGAYSGIGYNTNASQLFGSDYEKYSIHVLNNNELILRDYSTCNDYEEYHLTKVN